MAQKLSKAKTDTFQNLQPIPTLSTNPLHYPANTGKPHEPDYLTHSYRVKMQEVISNSTRTPPAGAWFAAECISAGAVTPNGREDNNIYAVFFPLDPNSRPIINSSYFAAAPCPPFCTDDNP